jgi:hypothetical protein
MLYYKGELVCPRCLYILDPSMAPFKPSSVSMNLSCENCTNDYCLNIHILDKIQDDAHQCCACDNKRRGRASDECCYACYLRTSGRGKRLLTYFHTALECDTPILECFWKQFNTIPWHIHIHLPAFNQFLVITRRIEYGIIHCFNISGSVGKEFLELLEKLGSGPPDLALHPTFQTFALRGGRIIIERIDTILKDTHPALHLMYCLLAEDFMERLNNTFKEHFPEAFEKVAPLIERVKQTHGIHVEGFFAHL